MRALICGHARPWGDDESTASRLRAALIAGGISAEEIGWLPPSRANILDDLRHKLEEVGRNAARADHLLVVVTALGGHERGVDYLSSTQEAGRVPLQEVVDAVALSGIDRCTLFIDVASQPDRLDRFGSQPLKLPKGVWVACSRAGRVSPDASLRRAEHVASLPSHAASSRTTSTEETASKSSDDLGGSVFLSALVDALGGAADVNGDREVRLFETAEFMNDAFESRNLPTPRVHGHADADLPLTELDEAGAARMKLPDEQRTALTQTLLEQARRTLLLERQIEGAERMLRRAAAYATSEQERREIQLMRLTVQAMNGDVGGALAKARSLGGPLLIVARQDAPLMFGGDVAGQIRRTEVVEVIEQSQDWFRAGTIHRVDVVDGQVQLTQRSAPQAWFNAANAVFAAPLFRNDKASEISRLGNQAGRRRDDANLQSDDEIYEEWDDDDE